MDADSLPVDKITISGPTLASILQSFSSSPGDIDGFLFGHFTPLPPPDPNDDLPSSSSLSLSPTNLPLFSASITSHFSSNSPLSFYNSIGRIDPQSPFLSSHQDRLPILLGWFCGRRNTPLRPSMREIAVSNSLFETLIASPPRPFIFLLISFSKTGNQAIHTHEYRAFHLRRKPRMLEPRSLSIVNIGPDFRGQYGSFSPDSAFPWMSLGVEDEFQSQVLLDSVSEGFGMERLKQLVGPGVEEYVLGLEDLYRMMLLKLEGLARMVEKSSARVLEQVRIMEDLHRYRTTL